jgi:hypothetical protein
MNLGATREDAVQLVLICYVCMVMTAQQQHVMQQVPLGCAYSSCCTLPVGKL